MPWPALVSKFAFSSNRSKKVRDPKLRAEGTECLRASQCTLLLPEVSGWGCLAFLGSFLVSSFLFPPSSLVTDPHLGTLGVLSTLPASGSEQADPRDDRTQCFKAKIL